MKVPNISASFYEKNIFTRLVIVFCSEDLGRLSIFAPFTNKRYVYEEDIYDISVNELLGLWMSSSK
jgi:hypothetical protein